MSLKTNRYLRIDFVTLKISADSPRPLPMAATATDLAARPTDGGQAWRKAP